MTVVSFKAAKVQRTGEGTACERATSTPRPKPPREQERRSEYFAGATVVVDRDGVFHCSDDGLVEHSLFERDRTDGGRIRPRGAAREKIEDLVAAAWAGERPCAVLCQDDGATYFATVSALSLGADDIVCCEIRPLSPPTWSDRDLADAFGLTVREAQIARCLLHGDPVVSIAARLQVKATTIRQYLKMIYSKTSTASQVQLIATLTGGLQRTPGASINQIQPMRSRP